MIRPEITALIARYGESAAALAMVALGLWFLTSPGPVLAGFGALLALAGGGWAFTALRRARFHADGAAPGVVDVIEGAVRYMGPVTGGAVAIADIVAIDVLVVGGAQRCWRLRQADGQALLIPQAATGAEALHDIFLTLPGLRARTLNAALRHSGGAALPVWRRADVRGAQDAPRLPVD